MKLKFYLFTTVYKCTTCPFSYYKMDGVACSNGNKEIRLRGTYYCIRSEGRKQL